ncbi:MAG: fimbrillin family protein, partial [Muribaculaceae bacterium]|nr:fimbrillin family protein [Muribaculaceae bacterium]
MKKHLFLLSLSAIALAGCTSTDVIEEGVQSNAIGFTNSIAKPSRSIDDAKDGDLTTETLDDIYVYGYYTMSNQQATAVQVFDGTEVSKNSNGVWTYTNTRYWVPNAKYFFYAYSCGDTQLKNTFGTPTLAIANDNTRVLRFSNYTCDNSHQHDLIYAFNEGIIGQSPTSETPNSKVNFQFKHILTKINARFISEFDATYKVIVSNVRVVNIRNMGNYDPKQNDDYKWNSVDRSGAYKFVSLTVSTEG